MAKGRKLTTSRSERLLGSYGYEQRFSGGEAGELGEEDVWSIMIDDRASPEPIQASLDGSNRSRREAERAQVGGLSLAFDDEDGARTASSRIVHQFGGGGGAGSASPAAAQRTGHQIAASAPMNVPDWSKILLRVDSAELLRDFDSVCGDESEDEVVPPHVFLAQQTRKPAANSVFEGVGRTLKGRDLSRVRDAVWRQTGFDG